LDNAVTFCIVTIPSEPDRFKSCVSTHIGALGTVALSKAVTLCSETGQQLQPISYQWHSQFRLKWPQEGCFTYAGSLASKWKTCPVRTSSATYLPPRSRLLYSFYSPSGSNTLLRLPPLARKQSLFECEPSELPEQMILRILGHPHDVDLESATRDKSLESLQALHQALRSIPQKLSTGLNLLTFQVGKSWWTTEDFGLRFCQSVRSDANYLNCWRRQIGLPSTSLRFDLECG
jgi:hypothetical protein